MLTILIECQLVELSTFTIFLKITQGYRNRTLEISEITFIIKISNPFKIKFTQK